MFFGIWNTARANRENIFYAIVTIVLLERVRTGWNKVETDGRKKGIIKPRIESQQRALTVKAALLYGLLLVLPIVKYIFRSIEELSWSVPGLLVLKSTWAFFAVVTLTECFLAFIIYHLLRIYIERMNAAVGFFAAIGRNIWDGSKMAVQVSTTVGSRIVGGVRSASNLSRAGVGTLKDMSTRLSKTARGGGSRLVSRLRRRPEPLQESGA